MVRASSKVQPTLIVDTYKKEDDANNQSQEELLVTQVEQEEVKGSYLQSIKFCLITLISGLILMSVLVLSATWISSFSPTMAQLSSAARDNEFHKIITYTESILREVAIASETVKQQLVGENFQMSNYDYAEKITYNTYKVCLLLL